MVYELLWVQGGGLRTSRENFLGDNPGFSWITKEFYQFVRRWIAIIHAIQTSTSSLSVRPVSRPHIKYIITFIISSTTLFPTRYSIVRTPERDVLERGLCIIGPGILMSTHASILVDSVGPPSAEVYRTAASFP
jgi:hypothetical protein